MSKLLHSRVFRFLVCFLLICCILVNVSPIKARAVDPVTLYALKFAAESIIASILISLGFEFCRYGMNQGITLVYDIFDYMAEELQPYYFVAGEMGLYTNNGVDFYVLQDAVEDIREYLFAESILTESGVKQLWSMYGDEVLPTFPTYDDMPYMLLLGTSTGVAMFHTSYPAYKNTSGYFLCDGPYQMTHDYVSQRSSLNNWNINSKYYHHNQETKAAWSTFNSYWNIYLWSNYDILSYTDGTVVHSAGPEPITSEDILCSYDIALGHVAPEDETLAVGYPEWNTGAIQIPGSISGLDEDYLGLPVALGTTFEETLGFTQDLAWQGLGTLQIQDPGYTDPSDPPVSPDVPSVVPDIGPYALDLTKYFPFCIPFDIYDFFSVLIAEPEAPKFHWEIQDLSGNTYPIDVDLSAWDSVASLFRRMQLLLFIVGLAAASRKFIKW